MYSLGAGGVAVRGGVGGVGMVPVQVPVSVANGHTVYQTVHLPVHAPQHLQIIPQLQQVGSFYRSRQICYFYDWRVRGPTRSYGVQDNHI